MLGGIRSAMGGAASARLPFAVLTRLGETAACIVSTVRQGACHDGDASVDVTVETGRPLGFLTMPTAPGWPMAGGGGFAEPLGVFPEVVVKLP